MALDRKLMNPIDAFLWSVDSVGNPTPFRIGGEGQLGIGVGRLVPLGNGQITLTGTTVSGLGTIPNGTTHAFMSIGGTADDFIRMSFSGNPSSGRGPKVIVGDYIDMTDPLSDFSQLINAIRFIRDSAAMADVILDIEFFGKESV